MKPFDIVMSLRGHDAGKLYMVTSVSEDRILLCDGRNRRQEKPKCKSPKHVRFVAAAGNAPSTDKEIRMTLAQAAKAADPKEE